MTRRRVGGQSLAVWALLAGVLVVASGCFTSTRRTQRTLRNQEAAQLLDSLAARAPEWQTLGLRLDAEASGMGNSGSFTMNVRMAKDSVIWMSITYGVEAARVLLTPDSVMVMNKLPGNRYVYLGNYDALERAVQAPVSFELVQSLLLGQPLLMDPDNEAYVSKIQQGHHVLMTRYDRNVRRLVGADDKELRPDDSLAIVVEDRRAERLLGKADEDEELLVKRYWIDGETYDPVRDVIDDLLRGRTIQVFRDDVEVTELGRLANRIRMEARGPEGQFDATFEVRRRRPGRAYDFPFTIPENFERRTSLDR